ncbi:MAG: hypothetical protein AAFV37_15050 [Pseudomonadota bacterium]
MKVASVLQSSAVFELHRHLRNPALLFVALAAPIAAHYMVPDKDAMYAVLIINGKVPVLTAPILGLELGVLAATLLTPLAYIFLRAGPSRIRPWQVTDITPHSRPLWVFGRWVSDTCTLWILLTALTVSGLILGIFRLEADANILQTTIALWLPAAPALALIAAIKLILDARPLTRGWVGDVVFFIVWITLIIAGVIGTTDPETDQIILNPVADAFGFVSPIVGSVDFPVTAVSIGGSSNTGESVMTDAWRGVTQLSYVSARGIWLLIAAGLAVFAGMIWAPKKPRSQNVAKSQIDQSARAAAAISNIPFNAPLAISSGRTKLLTVIVSEIEQIFRSRFWVIVLFGASVAGAALPFRSGAGPLIMLCLIFPIAEASARWQGKTTQQLLDTLGPEQPSRSFALFLATSLIAVLVAMPSAVLAILRSEPQTLIQIAMISILVPAVLVLLGAVTKSAVTGRLVMLIAWYAYLSSAG